MQMVYSFVKTYEILLILYLKKNGSPNVRKTTCMHIERKLNSNHFWNHHNFW